MNIKDLKPICPAIEFNNCNAWGFGGVKGIENNYDNGLSSIKGRRYYRKALSTTVNYWSIRYNGFLSEIHNLTKPCECSIFKIERHWDVNHKTLPYFVAIDTKENALKYYKKHDVNFNTYITDDISIVII